MEVRLLVWGVTGVVGTGPGKRGAVETTGGLDEGSKDPEDQVGLWWRKFFGGSWVVSTRRWTPKDVKGCGWARPVSGW